MIKQSLRILIALMSVAGFGVCAHGQTVDRISVKIQIGRASCRERVFVQFEQIGEQFFLTSIRTGEHRFTVPISRKKMMEAQASAKSHTATTTPVTSAGND